MAEIIELKNVNYSSNDGIIVEDISIGFDEAKTTAIVGPSGCGKSTVLKLAAGLMVPDQGEVLFKGKDISLMNRSENLEFRREGAFVFQDSALWANQDLYQILELPLKVHFPLMKRKERSEHITSVIKKVGYSKDLKLRPARLSIGEQKIIAFARALICDPSVLFLDEWTESLDENSAERFIDIIRSKQREGATIIFVSHDMRLIMDLADSVIMMIDGKVSVKAPKNNVIKDLLFNDFLKIGIAS